MKFAVVLGALAAVASALPRFTNSEFDVQEGKPITLTWADATGPVNIQILTGPTRDTLQPIQTIATGLTGTSFTYTPTGLPSGNYAFKIVQPSTNEENYSILFPYVGTASSSLSSSRSGSSTITSTSTSTSSSATSTTTDDETTTTTAQRTTATTPTTTRSTPTNTPANNNEGQRFGSSLAMVFITVAALIFFN